MKITTIRQCDQLLQEFTRKVGLHKGYKTDRTKQLSTLVGNPENSLRVVHVAGTSGKTSTCYYISTLLSISGSKTGLSVSPHIVSIADRVQINGTSLDNDIFSSYFSKFYDIVEASDVRPSYFEFMLVFALWVFKQENVDYAVIETGLGGLYDSSNICTRSDKVCCITDIGLDHQAILGDSIKQIAHQKAGIIWSGNHVFTYDQSTEIMDEIRQRAESEGANLHICSENYHVTNHSMPLFQRRNWQLARQVYDYIQSRDKLTTVESELIYDTTQIVIPARMEEYIVGGKTIIIDGAHNEQKMRTFFESFKGKYGTELIPVIILSLKQGKDYRSVIPIIAMHTELVIATEFKEDQDLPYGPQPAGEIVSELEKYEVQAIPTKSMDSALEQAMDSSNGDTIIIVGSLYAASEARKIILSNKYFTK
jgi:dihydrofolate synthase/folylpolyglutamate synthase